MRLAQNNMDRNPLDVFEQSEDSLKNLRTMLRQQADMELEALQASRSGDKSPYSELSDATEGFDETAEQKSILPSKYRVTQSFMNYNPEIEKYSGGYNYGVDFGTPENTAVALPSGNWLIKEATLGSFNKGYGNSVLAVNEDTGEQLRFSHLSKLNTAPNARIRGGSVVGYTGNTGNTTGPHIDIEYMTKGGKHADILKSRYANELYGGI